MVTPAPHRGRIQEDPTLLGLQAAPTLWSTISIPYITHHTIFKYFAERHVLTSMVRYVILRKFRQELPLWVSFRDPRGSDWFAPRGGHLREVAIPDIATWGAGLLPKDLSAEVPAVTELTDKDTGDSSDEEKGRLAQLTIAIAGTTHPRTPHLPNPSR